MAPSSSSFNLRLHFSASPVKRFIVAGAAPVIWAYQRHRQKTNVHAMALNLVRGVPLTLKEKQALIDILTPPQKRWSWRD